MASLTAKLRAIWAPFLHALFELTVMWIDMACSACTVGEAERQNFVMPVSQSDLVAIRASDRRVCARYRVGAFLVLRNRVSRAVKVGHRVAGFASVFVRLGRKLSVVCVFVAIQAGGQ